MHNEDAVEKYDAALAGSTAYRTFIDEDGIIEITHEVRAISQLVVGGQSYGID